MPGVAPANVNLKLHFTPPPFLLLSLLLPLTSPLPPWLQEPCSHLSLGLLLHHLSAYGHRQAHSLAEKVAGKWLHQLADAEIQARMISCHAHIPDMYIPYLTLFHSSASDVSVNEVCVCVMCVGGGACDGGSHGAGGRCGG